MNTEHDNSEATEQAPRIRYLVAPPVGFCASFVIWAESTELATVYAKEWLGVVLPPMTLVIPWALHKRIAGCPVLY